MFVRRGDVYLQFVYFQFAHVRAPRGDPGGFAVKSKNTKNDGDRI